MDTSLETMASNMVQANSGKLYAVVTIAEIDLTADDAYGVTCKTLVYKTENRKPTGPPCAEFKIFAGYEGITLTLAESLHPWVCANIKDNDWY